MLGVEREKRKNEGELEKKRKEENVWKKGQQRKEEN
jgi:hypothetical protein